jgi:hypothetical protein
MWMKIIKKYHWFIAAIVFILSALYITHPLLFNLGSLAVGLGDELLIAWIYNWVPHALSTDPLNLFNANIYYPYTNTLAYSELFLTTSIIATLPAIFINEPMAAVNFTTISSLALLGFSVYILAHYITKNYAASLISGLLVTFSPAVIDKFVHIQMLAIYFVPLSIVFFLLFINTKKTKYLSLCMLCFALQTLNSILPGYFIAFSLTILSVFYYFYNKKAKSLVTKKNGLVIAISLLVIIPFILPYFLVSREFNYVRDIRDTIHLAMQFEDFFYVNTSSKLEPILSSLQSRNDMPDVDYKFGFIGGAFTLLSIGSIIFFVRNYKKQNWTHNAIFGISIFGLIMSLGPFLHLFRATVHEPFPIPLPYVIFYYLIPGFQGIRNSSRWEMLFIIAIAIVIAVVLHQVLKNTSKSKQFFIYSFLIICIIAEFNFPLRFQQVPRKKDFPQVYSWLNTTPKDTVIIEMPIYTWDMQPYVMNENLREYYSTVHFRKMVNGASGFSPPPWQESTRSLLKNFPNDNAIQKLSSMDVDYIIVHKGEYDVLYRDKFIIDKTRITHGEDVIAALRKSKKVTLVKKFEKDYVFRITK